MDLKQSLLFKQVKMGEFFNEFPVRPAILIEPLQFVKSRETQSSGSHPAWQPAFLAT